MLGAFSARKEEHPDRYLHASQIKRKLGKLLDRALSESVVASDDHGAMIVMKRACDNLGSRGRQTARQDDQWPAPHDILVIVRQDLDMSIRILGADHAAFADEQAH